MSNSDQLGGAVTFTILDILFVILFQCIIPMLNYLIQNITDEGAGKIQQISVFLFGFLFITTPSIVTMIIMWEIYHGNIKYNNNDTIFWIMAVLPTVIAIVILFIVVMTYNIYKCRQHKQDDNNSYVRW